MLLLSTLGILAQGTAESTIANKTYQFRHLSIQNGMADSTINDVVQDHRGFVWLATTQGLSRYDGYHFENYYYSIKNPNSISSNWVTNVFVDSQHRFWVGTRYGLNLMDMDKGEFRHFFTNPSKVSSLDDDIILDITEDATGQLWVATPKAVNRYSDDNDDFNRFYFYGSGISDLATINFIIPHQDTILVGTSLGLYQYDLNKNTFSRLSESVGLPEASHGYRAAFHSDDGTLWLGIDNLGLMFKPEGSDRFIHAVVNKEAQTLLARVEIKSLNLVSQPEQLWIATTNSGLYSYDIKAQTLYQITQRASTTMPRFDTAPLTGIFKDNSGLIWVSTDGAGVYLWNRYTQAIEHIGAVDDLVVDDRLAANIWKLTEGPEGRVWVGTRHGLLEYNPKTKEYRRIKFSHPKVPSEPEIFWLDFQSDLIWMATDQGILAYNTVAEQVIKYIPPPKINLDEIPASEVNIYALALIDNTLLYAVDEVGIFAVDTQTNEPINLSITANGTSSHLVRRPVGLVKDKNNSLWILTRDGLINYSLKKDMVLNHFQAGINELSDGRVSALYQEDAYTYWVGTSGNGFNRLHFLPDANGQYVIEQFDNPEPLGHLIITGLLLDDNEPSNLWLSSHSGLYLFDLEQKHLHKFDTSEGAQAREFNEGAYMKDEQGFLYFGGVNGFNRINPSRLITNQFQPPLRITQFELNCEYSQTDCTDKKTELSQQINCLNTPNCNTKEIKFPHDIGSLKLEFSSLNYTKPNANIYRYRFKQDNETPWTRLGTTNSITFTRLESGHYDLEIQGSDYSAQWSENKIQFSFEVDRPWYLENYSILGLILIFLSSLYYYLVNRRLSRVEKKRIEQAIKKYEENFKFALWGSGDELWEWNLKNKIMTRTNPIKQVALDNHLNDFTMEEYLKVVHPDDRQRFQRDSDDFIRGKSAYFEFTFRVKSKGTGYIWVIARARIVDRDPNNRALRVLGSLKDITMIKATEDKLTLIAQAFENTKDGISVVDKSFKSVFNNKAFYEITGLTHIEAMHKQYFFSEDKQNHDMFHQVMIALNNFGEWEGEIWEQRPNGESFAISLNIAVVLETADNQEHYICVFSDITYKKRSEEELIKLANIDALTELPNRTLFLDRLSHAIAYSKRNKTLFALLFIDLDNFKNINDSLGHSMGDKLLISIADRLRKSVRDVDTVARLGGDEFTVILENINNPNEVGVCANKILEKLTKPLTIDNMSLKSTPSIGIGIYPEHGDDIETLLKNADLAMYSAKEKGKNNYQFFTEDMTSSAMERISIENRLREAIKNKQLELYYQPKLFSVTGELTGFEALIRWIHPTDGMISPASFIPVAEETGLILPLGNWIIEQAVKQAKKWSEINSDCCCIAVNISAKQFHSSELPERISALLEKYQLEAKYIELEITEGTLMENMQHTISSLNRLRDMGLSISLDDFGTGYSSLNYLKQFPVNKLKIDQSFIHDITTDPSDASIVASIITLAHNLGLSVIAEGCETIEQLEFIRSYHCEQVQGYLFSKPLPRKEAQRILKQGRIIIDET